MMKLVAQGKIKKKTLPGSDIPRTNSKPDINISNSEQLSYKHFVHDGRNYVNDGLNELDGNVQGNNEVINQ